MVLREIRSGVTKVTEQKRPTEMPVHNVLVFKGTRSKPRSRTHSTPPQPHSLTHTTTASHSLTHPHSHHHNITQPHTPSLTPPQEHTLTHTTTASHSLTHTTTAWVEVPCQQREASSLSLPVAS
ncbi:hypothetical protein E2C01_034211 [Portunus trituberculatus]|uniref:Uncharacterized protein n=1 Tax=Portunus trituberculatus TaxID=210409 RepID=A0A5B7F561_PORTR|nr:hypothetical protein [Portunus trituberculatus]